MWHGTRGTIWLFQGRTEYIEKYGPVVAHLTQAGWGVVSLDWRGQGLSDRPKPDPNLGDIRDFATYQLDVDAVLSMPGASALPRPWVLMAHSMGGGIGLAALNRGVDMQAAVFSAPMWDLPRPRFVGPFAQTLLAFAIRSGQGRRYFVGTTPRNHALDQPFPINPLTGDKKLYAAFVAQLKAHPDLNLGGPSLRWIRAALRLGRQLARAPAPSLPILTLLGTRETVVSSEAIRQQTARQPAARLVEIEGGNHEIFIETPERQAIAWREIDAFLADIT